MHPTSARGTDATGGAMGSPVPAAHRSSSARRCTRDDIPRAGAPAHGSLLLSVEAAALAALAAMGPTEAISKEGAAA